MAPSEPRPARQSSKESAKAWAALQASKHLHLHNQHALGADPHDLRLMADLGFGQLEQKGPPGQPVAFSPVARRALGNGAPSFDGQPPEPRHRRQHIEVVGFHPAATQRPTTLSVDQRHSSNWFGVTISLSWMRQLVVTLPLA